MSASKVVTDFFQAVEQKQMDRAFALLADDLVVEGPAPVPLGKQEYHGGSFGMVTRLQ